MSIHIGARDARNNFADLLGRVHYSGDIVIIERSGKPMVAVTSIDEYQRLIAKREARFEVLDGIRQRLPKAPEDEVRQDVSEAIAAVRRRSP